MRLIGKYDNLAVMRTFSKGMGAAGVRLGYILADSVVAGAAAKGQRPLLQERAGRAHRRVAHPLRLGWQVPRPRRRRTSRVCSPRLKKLKYAETCMSVPITMLYTDDESVDLCALLERVGIRAITCAGYEGLGANGVRLNIHQNVDRLIELLLKAEELL